MAKILAAIPNRAMTSPPQPNRSGLSVSLIEAEELSKAAVTASLRALARVMVRGFGNGDPAANVATHTPPSRLTVACDPSPHPCDDAA